MSTAPAASPVTAPVTAPAGHALAEALVHTLRAAAPDTAVELIETHISCVILAGPTAWKLKKPLRLPFLDYTTLAARHAGCLEELRLNRRSAPQLYQMVRPVLGPAEAPRLGHPDSAADAAQAIDWAVQMHRFDPAAGLDRLAARGQLDAALIDRLARALADWQATLPAPPEPGRQPGDAATVWRWADDNLTTLATLCAGQPERAEAVARLRRWTTQRFAALAPLMAERHRAGRVREGHGDLHLGNWVRLGGVPVAFDAIEFNAELRWIDPVAELAFPFMDLLAHGRHDLAWRLASGWFERSGDYAGAPLLGWFAVYRALVRAKVALIEAGQRPTGAATPGCAQGAAPLARAEAHLRLALRLARLTGSDQPAPPPPLLIALAGLSGSGKSTLAQCAVEQFGALRLRSDVERKRLFGMRPQQRPGQDGAPPAEQLYATAATERTFARLDALARQLLAAGLSVVYDAASLRRRERDARRQLAHEAGAQHLLLHCQAPPEVLAARVRARTQRADDASDADVAVLQRQLDVLEPPGADEQADTLPIDTDRPIEALCATLAQDLRTWRDTNPGQPA